MLIEFKNKEYVKAPYSTFPVPVNERCFCEFFPDDFVHSAFERCHEYLNMLEKSYKKTEGARSFFVSFEFNFGVTPNETPLF